MAKFGPLKNAFISVSGVDLSDHLESVTINDSIATLDDSAMGDNTDLQVAGLLSWTIEANFFQDFAASKVDATVHPLYSGGTKFAVIVRPTNAAASATNPQWSGQAFVSSYTPISGSHGDNLMAAITFSPASDLTRSTS